MKKIIALIIMALIVISLGACGKDKARKAPPQPFPTSGPSGPPDLVPPTSPPPRY